ncbi:MAG: AI-2E family transporter [Sphingomonadales bacterium]|nr:AI-2E family transporter [Sphingomonadales bacterium]MBD3772053.1 AI-2E family transporter [Paracoccaceae bacterium]
MSDAPKPEAAATTKAPPRAPRASRTLAFAQEELRLMSALVVLLGVGVFFALPFVLSIGSVVFLPLTTAVVLTVILSPLADRFARLGLPNVLSSLFAMLIFLMIVMLALALILQPAVALFDDVPAMVRQVVARFSDLRDEFSWIARIEREFGGLTEQPGTREVVLATPSVIEQLAFATPSVLIEVLLTILMSFFMIESRVHLRQRLIRHSNSFDSNMKAAKVLREVQDRVAAYILTVSLINLGVGVIVAVGAWALGVDAPVMWGGLAALLNFLPYVGPVGMAALLALFGIGTAETMALGIVPALAYLGLHAVESNFVTPSILGARFTVNPVLILLALSYFSWIWGVPGALLSVPILLMITAFFDHVGRPNLVGFIFGEPLFSNNVLALGQED